MNRTSANQPGAGGVDDAARDCIRFVLDGKVHSVTGIAATKTVLAYVRDNLLRTGTKEGCAEGDCGACTVVVAELDGDVDTGDVRIRAVNACLQLLPFLDGKALFTVESLKQRDGTLHPVQQAMVACHGSQCGFCTPGFVMSMYALYVDHCYGGTRPTDRDARTALAGNLCRCTGYRPILDATKQMFELPAAPFGREALRAQLMSVRRASSLDYQAQGFRFSAPRTLAELHALRAQFPDATLIAGNTDVGLWINKQLRELRHLIYTVHVAELLAIEVTGGAVRVGAAVSLEDAYAALTGHYPELSEMWERFASPPIRNAGTLGGNVANGSPIGDSMPGLIALGARVVVSRADSVRTLPIEDFYLGYQKKDMAADEIVEAIEVPIPTGALRFRTYKISKRYDSDISALCAAFALRLDAGTVVVCRIAYGGMDAIPKRARRTEAALRGRQWTEAAVNAALGLLAEDFQPLSDHRAGAAYRMQVAQNLLVRFWMETRDDAPLAAAAVSVFGAAAAR